MYIVGFLLRQYVLSVRQRKEHAFNAKSIVLQNRPYYRNRYVFEMCVQFHLLEYVIRKCELENRETLKTFVVVGRRNANELIGILRKKT